MNVKSINFRTCQIGLAGRDQHRTGYHPAVSLEAECPIALKTEECFRGTLMKDSARQAGKNITAI